MKKSLIFSIFLCLCTAFGYALDTNINTLIPTQTTFPGCTEKDNYWIYQAGPDFIKPNPVSPSAIILNADEITGQQGYAHFAKGNVLGYKDDKTVMADWMIYDQKKAHATGGDHVVLTRQFDQIKGKWIDYYMDLDKGTILDANALQSKTDMYASGKKIDVLSKKKYVVYDGYLTTCDPKNPDWHFKSNQTTFDYNDSEGNAKGVTFYAESIPLFYTPYLQFPLGERKSGFLVPEIGNNSNQQGPSSGFLLGIPYYWNMAPNYDMTIEPKYFSNDGFMLADQFRYLDSYGKGEIYTEQLPNDWQTGQYRYYWHMLDDHTPVDNLHVGYSYNSVSDNDYFVYFGNFNSTVNNIDLDRSVYANYTPSWGNLGILAQGYQVLQPINSPPTSPIYSELPQVNFNINPIPLGNSKLKANLTTQYTSFYAPSLQNGQRAYLYPSVNMPLLSSWGFITPKVGYSYTNYTLDPLPGYANYSRNIDRNVPITSLDSGLTFERPVTLGDTSYAQTLEPRLYYLYIPAVNQANLPIFDTSTATYNINQLFSENRFAGLDRVNMANDITAGVRSRFLNDNTGTELANWALGYRYFITPENNFLYGTYTNSLQLFLPQPNLIAELGNNWAKGISTNANFQYDTAFQNVDAYTLQAKYNPDDYKIVNLKYSYQYQLPLLFYAPVPGQPIIPNGLENQYALDLSGQWPLFSDHWLIEGRTNYDLTFNQFLNVLGGLEYNAGCWSVRAIYENYINAIGFGIANNNTSAFYVEFTLKGIANIGNGDPTTDLNLNIPGYMPISNIR